MTYAEVRKKLREQDKADAADAVQRCSMPGCSNRWSQDFGKRLCASCARPAPTTKPIALQRPADDEEVPF